jgi:predicted nuclease of predicted toxin-antitoxin system
MLRLLSDENFHGDIVRGLFLREPNLDLQRVQDVGLRQFEDPEILEWAAQNDRILLTHDRATIPDFAYDRVLKGQPMPGAFIVNNQMAIRQAIDEILLLVNCTQQSEWSNIILYLPM